MRLLILGGTVFLGRHLVEAALAAGHGVTLFNRGRHDPDLFPAVEKLRGDRDGDLRALEEGTWDAVVDTCGYVPRVVGQSAALLADRVEHYTFISSISVYADFSQPGITEDAPVGVLADPTVDEVTGETYGPLKALCEEAAEAAMPGRMLVIRPGLIVGPHDPTGIYNATGPAAPYTLGELLESCRRVTDSDATFVWADEAFLTARELQPFTELPLWTPAAVQGIEQVDCRKAMAAGLTFRPTDAIVADTLAWYQAARGNGLRAGLEAAQEAALIGEVGTSME
jgi:2'-hydroxyisoflavone reductase